LPLESVREVVTPQPPFAQVPRTSEAVRGAMNLRGRVVAVVDLAELVGLARQSLNPKQGQVLVLERSWRGLGFLIEAVLGVEVVDPPNRTDESAIVRGVSSLRGVAVTVLDPEALAVQSRSLFSGH
jgi:purine-binding chemotaxis protein CheW